MPALLLDPPETTVAELPPLPEHVAKLFEVASPYDFLPPLFEPKGEPKGKPSFEDVLRAEWCRYALHWVNKMRTLYGAASLPALVPGVPRAPYKCTIALSLIHEVRGIAIVRRSVRLELGYGRNFTFRPPPLVVEFIDRFDKHEYPDLIAS